MQMQEMKRTLETNDLTITQKLVFLVESLSQSETDEVNREYYLFAVTGAGLADLLIRKKLVITDNRIKIQAIEKTEHSLLNRFLYEVALRKDERTVLEIITEMQEFIVEYEHYIRKELLDEGLLLEKREGLPLIGHKVTYPKNKVLLDKLMNEITEQMDSSKELRDETLYIITLLEAIGQLQKIYEVKDEIEYGQKRLENEIENDHVARLLYRGIQNKIKLEELRHMSGPKPRSNQRGMM